ADLDGSRARARGFEVAERSAEGAAEVFWRCATDFTLFEHFAADEAAHERDAEGVERALGTFDAFARAVIAARPADAQVLITSDHGNAEDLTIRQHTLNRVPLLSFGGAAPAGLHDVSDVGKYVLRALGADA